MPIPPSLRDRSARDGGRAPRRGRRLVVAAWSGGGLLLAATVLAVALHDAGPPAGARRGPVAGGSGAPSVPAVKAPAARLAAADPAHEAAIPDDGHTLWVSPTAGAPIDLAYLPGGTQFIGAVRPARILAHPEGVRLVDAAGPNGAGALDHLARILGIRFAQIDSLTFGVQTGDRAALATTFVIRPCVPVPDWPGPGAASRVEQHRGVAYRTAGHWAYFQPSGSHGSTLVVTPAAMIGQVIEAGRTAAPLRRGVERLLAHSDADRLLTLLFPASFLLGDGRELLAGPLARLRSPIDWLLDDNVQAVEFSAHLDENLFLELRLFGSLDAPPRRLAGELAARIGQLGARTERYVAGLTLHQHGQEVVSRLPRMAATVGRYTRSVALDDHVLARCYLPAVAAHNLLLATELVLTESAPAAAASAAPSMSIRDRLRRPTTLAFDQDTLAGALAALAADAGVEIVILGKDLELEGITKNQSFGIAMAGVPARTILEQILIRANPDRTARGLSDPKQKLVYVVKPRLAGGGQIVYVTTRAQAASRGDTLPEAFVAGKEEAERTEKNEADQHKSNGS